MSKDRIESALVYVNNSFLQVVLVYLLSLQCLLEKEVSLGWEEIQIYHLFGFTGSCSEERLFSKLTSLPYFSVVFYDFIILTYFDL